MICSIVVLYEPKQEEIFHICDYYDKVDIIYVLDNSKCDNRKFVYEILDSSFEGCSKIQYYHFSENVGLCKALNLGMKYAKKNGCEWALIMDADSSFITNIVESYKRYLKICSCSNKIAVLSPVHIFDRSSNKAYDGEKKVKWAMTSGCLYNIDIFEKIGGFMEELFVDGLDIDYCYRARNSGYEVIECGNALLKHHPADTKVLRFFGKPVFKYGISSPTRYRIQARSLIWLIYRYKQFTDVIRYVWKSVKVLLFFDNKTEYIRNLVKGTQEGISLCREKKFLSNK